MSEEQTFSSPDVFAGCTEDCLSLLDMTAKDQGDVAFITEDGEFEYLNAPECDDCEESGEKCEGDCPEERAGDCGTGGGGFKPGNTCAKGGQAVGSRETQKKKMVGRKQLQIS